jgi:thymidylate synthase (FAD)
MNAKLVSITQPCADLIEQGILTADDLIAYCARVSNPSNQLNTETAPRLLAYCIKHGHWSVFETASMTVEVETSRAIAAQLLRHRSFTFQEFCVSGNTKITLELPNGIRKGKRASYKRTIKHLFKLQSSAGKMPTCVRVFDETTRTFTTAAIKEVFETGVKPLYRVTLENGRSIDSTKEHKFLTTAGFKSLEDAVGLERNDGRVTWARDAAAFACNGIPIHQDKSWMIEARQRAISSKRGLPGIAEEAGISYHTVRKWMAKHGLQLSKLEVASYSPTWNKGKRYKGKPHSLEAIEKMRASAKRGPESNLWRGGVQREERQRIADWCSALRSEFLKRAQYKCARCGSSHKLELHHIVPVFENKALAMEPSNIEVLCFACHRAHHKILGHAKSWREKSTGNRLTVHWSKVKSIEYIGEEMTYDIEVDHHSHNYVGNGIVTHNSQRYAASSDYEFIELRQQDQKNRQASGDICKNIDLGFEAQGVINVAFETYRHLISKGVSKETARMVLPLCTRTRMYVTGNVRSWIHYFDQRCAEHTQKEHRELACLIREIFSKQFPNVFNAINRQSTT